MRRIFALPACLAALSIVACTGDSSLPTPTGKGTLRAINAVPTSPEIGFLIEERLIGSMEYRSASNSARYDDFVYTFSFDARFPGETTRRRIASQQLDVIAGKDYTFVVSGPLSGPTITLWEADEREWGGSETDFQVRIGHTAASLDEVDVYLAAPGTAPVQGAERGTLSFGAVLPAADLPEGDYVLTITTAGDPAAVLFESTTVSFSAQSAVTLVAFDGGGNDPAPVSVRSFSARGGTLRLPDVNFPPTLRFVHASTALGTADVYADAALTTPILTGHAYGDVSGDLPLAIGDILLTYTAAGNVGAILFQEARSLSAGTFNRYVIIGGTVDELAGRLFVPDRRPVETVVKFRFMHAASNHETVDVYIVEADAGIADAVPSLIAVPFGFQPVRSNIDAGSYDIYVTVGGDETIITGPVRMDVALGDIVDTIMLDTVDPATAEIRFIPPP